MKRKRGRRTKSYPMRDRIRDVFSSDTRSLVLFRAGLAVLIILDLANRARDIVAHYTDGGVMPRAVVVDRFTSWYVSTYFMSGEAAFILAMFLVAAVFAFMLLAGYRTTLATIASWFLLISLQSRNPLILQGGDVLFRILLFWAMFIPLGIYFSLDREISKKRSKGKAPKKVFSIGTIAVLVQVSILYIFTALLKTGMEWFPDGTAVYYALSIDQFTTQFGLFLYQFPGLMQFLTYFVLIYWVVGVLLLYVPSPPVRTFAILVFILVQAGMGLSMKLGLFPLIAMVALFPLIPSWFWDDLLPKMGVKKFRSLGLKGVRSYFDFSKKKYIALTVTGAFFMFFIFLWNVQSVSDYSIPRDMKWIGWVTRTDQKWSMFSPRPLTDDGWYVIPGSLRNGSEVDLFNGGEVSYEKPSVVSATYKNQRWRKYMMNLWKRRYQDYREYYAEYLCDGWNEDKEADEQLIELEIAFMREDTLPDYETSEPTKVILLEHSCFR